MKTRPLSVMCLFVLVIQIIILLFGGGQSMGEIPASSIFYDRKKDGIEVQGQVYKKTYTSKIQILYLKNNSVTDSKILIYDDNFTDVSIGETIRLKGTKDYFDTAHNPGNYDQYMYYARQGIYGFIWCDKIVNISGQKEMLKESLFQIKMRWKERILSVMGEKNGAILSAMLLGEKNEMDGDTKELYQKNGIGHILAISGLHISFIGMGIYHLLRKTGLPYWLSGILSVFVLYLYVLMIGLSISVFRAFVMLLFKIGAEVSGRVYDMLTALLCSATITILYEPLYLTDAAFCMSYGAILGIIFVVPAVQKSVPCKWKWLSGFYASLAIQIMLLPILLWFYYEIPTYSVFINMIIIPLMSVIMSLGMLGSELSLTICGWILDFFEFLSEICAKLPKARLVWGKPHLWEVIIYYLILAGILLLIAKKRTCKKRIWLLLGIPLFLLAYHKSGDLTFTMLDVGQGDGLFFRGPNGNTYLVDGGSSDVEHLGKYRIEPFLKSQGVGELDYVFLTHGDVDHYSGVVDMIERQDVGVKIRTLILSSNYKEDTALRKLTACAKKAEIRVFIMHADDEIVEENMILRCIQPNHWDKQLEGNEGSMVLEIEYKKFSMLLTGDVEAEGERRLIKRIKDKEYDVLKVAHHGSKNSTTEAFLQVVQPKIALISAGKENSYGHPHQETLLRLEKVGCKIVNTAKNGTICFRTDGNLLTFF